MSNGHNQNTPVGEPVNMSNVLLKCIFPKSGSLNLCHMNVGSWFPKISELRSIFAHSSTHIIAVSETWLKSHISNKSATLPGYKIFRADRKQRTGGGVAILVDDRLRVKTVLSSRSRDTPCIMDYLFVEIIFPYTKVLVGVIYKPPNVNELNVLSEVLDGMTSNYSEIIIAGDINEDQLCASKRQRLTSIFNPLSLRIMNSTIPTHHHHNGTSTLLDLFVVNNVSKVSRVNQIELGFFDHGHDMLTLSYK